MSVQLRDGRTVEDPRLDRLPEFDERSRNYPITTETGVKVRSYTWRCFSALDQGNEGACVGFAIAHELAARPSEVQGLTDTFARDHIYWEAQKIDPWAGGSYPGASPHYEGTSELAGLKVAMRLGYFDSYWWGFSLEQTLYGIGHRGPALFATRWDYPMYRPNSEGWITPNASQMVGYHLILANRVKLYRINENEDWVLPNIDLDRSWVGLHNSWGRDWNSWGGPACRISVRNFDILRRDQGTISFALSRHREAEPPR